MAEFSEQGAPLRDVANDTWVATDGLGRTLPGFAECGPPRAGRFVGMFYFVWLGWHDSELHDLTKIVAANPGAPEYGPTGMFHWWGEPRFGYYRSDDRWVIRKHAEMLTDAGVDVIILDVTNGFTYDPTVAALCEEYAALRALGQPTPQIAFLTNSKSAEVVRHLWESFYAVGRFRELWFDWKGKPLLMSSTEGIDDPAILDFFSWRHSWAWTEGQAWFGDGRDKWAWLDHHPQNAGWHESPDRPEQMSVCVAQHPISDIGRSFHGGVQPSAADERPFEGLCFQEQWDRALAVDPEFVFVTGWNEWVAQRFLKQAGTAPDVMNRRTLAPGDSFFVDQYSLEFSRDIEPMRGGYGDAYYYQLVANIRRFKGVRPTAKAPAELTTISVEDADFAAWEAVEPTFLDNIGEIARNHPGWGQHHYRQTGAYIAFDTMKVARDASSLYFYVRSCDDISDAAAYGSMRLLLAIKGDCGPTWEGFGWMVYLEGWQADLRRNVGGNWEWSECGDVAMSVGERELHLAIPRSALNLEAGSEPLSIDFKWISDYSEPDDSGDFIDAGSMAPSGRFRYRFQE